MKKKMIMLGLLVALPFQICLCDDSSNGDSLERQFIEEERLQEEALLKEATDTSLQELERLARLEREDQADRERQRQRLREHEEAMARLKQQQKEEEERIFQQAEKGIGEAEERERIEQSLMQPVQPNPYEEELPAQIPEERTYIPKTVAQNTMPNIRKITMKNPRIKRVIVMQQLILADDDTQEMEDITSGPRALFIAEAINSIVKDGREITPESIHAELSPSDYHAAVSRFLAQGKQLSSIEIGPFMENNGIKIPNLFLLGSYGNTITALAKNQYEEGDVIALLDVPQQLKALSGPLMYNTLADPVHVMCTDSESGHWVLFSIIPHKGQPQVWYIDPNNVYFIEYKPAHPFLTYIVENLMPKRAHYSRVRDSLSRSQ